MAEVARSCLASPRADNLLIRVCTFDDTLHEVHGFRPLASSGAGDYTGSCRHGGTTALYDATLNAVASITDYAKTLDAADFEVNGILFVITDGGDNASQADLAKVADAFERARRSAGLDSLVSVLVGVGVADANLRTFLEDFRTRAGFTAYVELPRADAATLARLAHFVSKSVMRQSQVLGAGGLASLIGF